MVECLLLHHLDRAGIRLRRDLPAIMLILTQVGQNHPQATLALAELQVAGGSTVLRKAVMMPNLARRMHSTTDPKENDRPVQGLMPRRTQLHTIDHVKEMLLQDHQEHFHQRNTPQHDLDSVEHRAVMLMVVANVQQWARVIWDDLPASGTHRSTKDGRKILVLLDHKTLPMQDRPVRDTEVTVLLDQELRSFSSLRRPPAKPKTCRPTGKGQRPT